MSDLLQGDRGHRLGGAREVTTYLLYCLTSGLWKCARIASAGFWSAKSTEGLVGFCLRPAAYRIVVSAGLADISSEVLGCEGGVWQERTAPQRSWLIARRDCAENLGGSSLNELKGFDQRGAIAVPELDVIG
jgi:hypothetical protein